MFEKSSSDSLAPLNDRTTLALSLLALVVLLIVLWLTLGIVAILVVPLVAATWVFAGGPAAFSTGQLLVLFELDRWLRTEALIVEAALGLLLLVSLVEQRRTSGTGGYSDRLRLTVLFVVGWSILGAVGWITSTFTGSVVLGAIALLSVVVSAFLLTAYHRSTQPSGGER